MWVACLAKVEPTDIGDRNPVRIPAQNLNLLTCNSLPRLDDREVKAAPPAHQEALRHVITLEPKSQLVTWDTRLSDLEDRCADAQAVTHAECVFAQPFRCEILTKHAPRK